MVTARDLMTDDYISIGIQESASSLIGKMSKNKKSYALVFNGKDYLGLVSREWLLTSRIDSDKMKLSNLVKHRSKSKTPFYVPKLLPETELVDVCRLIATADVYALPVLQKNKVIGVVEAQSVLLELAGYFKAVRASDIAHSPVFSLNESDAIGFAIKTMSMKNVDRITVVNDDGNLVGVLSLMDIADHVQIFPSCSMSSRSSRAVSLQYGKKTSFGVGETSSLLDLPLKNVITAYRRVCRCSANDSVSDAIKLMKSENVGSILVMQNDVPRGIITIKDVLRAFVKG